MKQVSDGLEGARVLREELRGWSGDCVVFLSAELVTLGVVERVEGLAGRGDWIALATKALVIDLGRIPRDWTVQTAVVDGGNRAVACAVRRELLEPLRPSGFRTPRPDSIQAWPLALARSNAISDHVGGVTVTDGEVIVGLVDSEDMLRVGIRPCPNAAVAGVERKRQELALGVGRCLHFEARHHRVGLPTAPQLDFADLLEPVGT